MGLLCLWKYDISDPSLVDLTSNFFVLCTNVSSQYYLSDIFSSYFKTQMKKSSTKTYYNKLGMFHSTFKAITCCNLQTALGSSV